MTEFQQAKEDRMFIPDSVTITEVAKAVRKSEAKATAECTELGILVGTDWASRPAVSTVDAHALVSGQARASRISAAKWHEHQVATEKWEADRQRAFELAAAEAHNAATRRGVGGPSAHTAAQEAGTEAAKQFERKNRMPLYEGTPTTKLWYDDREKVTS
jgi:hypothetical protein